MFPYLSDSGFFRLCTLYHSAQIPEWLCTWYLSMDYASLGLWYLLPLIIPLLSTGPHKAGCSSTLHLGHAHPVSGIHLSQPWGWCTPNRILHSNCQTILLLYFIRFDTLDCNTYCNFKDVKMWMNKTKIKPAHWKWWNTILRFLVYNDKACSMRISSEWEVGKPCTFF